MCAVGVIIPVIIVLEWFQKDKAAGILVAEQLQTIVCGFFKIAETYDVAVALDGVEYAVGARVGLQQAMIPQVLVNPQSIERCRVEAREEHVDYNQQVDFAVLDAERKVFVVVLEFVGARVVACAEHFVIVVDALIKKFTAALVETCGIFGSLIVNVNIGSIAEYRCDFQPLVRLQLLHLFFQFGIVELDKRDRGNGENGVEALHSRFSLNLLYF